MLRMMVLAFALAAVAGAAIPSWVQPGVVVAYDGVSSGIQNGQPVNGVQTLMTFQVTSVSGNTVTGTYNITNPLIDPSIWQMSGQWSCTDGQKCDSRFWVDPSNPAASIKGPNGEAYTSGGQVQYQSPVGGPAVSDTYILYYSNADTHVEYHVTYQKRTGLIVAYAEKYPTEQVYIYYKSINADLAGYQPPAGTGGAGIPCVPALILLLAGVGLAKVVM